MRVDAGKTAPHSIDGTTMTLTLDVAPEVERALAAKAARAGLPLGEFLRRLIERVAFDEFDEVGASANGKAAAPPAQPTAQPIQFSDDRETRNAQIRALFHAPPEVIEATLRGRRSDGALLRRVTGGRRRTHGDDHGAAGRTFPR